MWGYIDFRAAMEPAREAEREMSMNHPLPGGEYQLKSGEKIVLKRTALRWDRSTMQPIGCVGYTIIGIEPKNRWHDVEFSMLDGATPLPYEVCWWSSHPDDGNDDCNTGESFATLAEAREHFQADASKWTLLRGPDVREVLLPTRPAEEIEAEQAADRARFRDECRREQAMQAGMAFGCQAHNDVMGY